MSGGMYPCPRAYPQPHQEREAALADVHLLRALRPGGGGQRDVDAALLRREGLGAGAERLAQRRDQVQARRLRVS